MLLVQADCSLDLDGGKAHQLPTPELQSDTHPVVPDILDQQFCRGVRYVHRAVVHPIRMLRYTVNFILIFALIRG